MAIGLTGVVVWRLNEAYGLKETFGEFIGGYLAAHSASILPNDARVIALNQELANERLLFTENNFHRKPVHRISFPGIFERASDRLVSPGTQANLDGLVIKHTWQRNSDLDEAIKKLQEN